jgi:hypothetical protein
MKPRQTYSQVCEQDAEKFVICSYIFEDALVGSQVDQDGEGMLRDFLCKSAQPRGLIIDKIDKFHKRRTHWVISNQELEVLDGE